MLNFGVAAGRNEFSLELVGKNIMDFRCPDERQNNPTNEPIEVSRALTFNRFTDLDLKSLEKTLQFKGHMSKISRNAGEYICNYIYY